ncbi:hypothetical protein EON65_26185 [archaeon]|nr:MAG: hypothetical protein EON65_26185 [archaeon]
MEYEVKESLDQVEDHEIGNEKVVFSISSAKPGNGVEQLRDNSLDTYWQSDGTAPHTVNIQFLHKVFLSKLCIYLDHAIDESYTPRKFTVSAGSCLHDLADLLVVQDLSEPSGWVVIDLEKCNARADPASSDRNYLRTHFLQIKVQAMQQNGKDCHVRQVKIFGARESPRVMANLYYEDFKTDSMIQYAILR